LVEASGIDAVTGVSTRWAVLLLVGTVAAIAVVAARRVPWDRRPVARVDRLAALAQLPPDQVARGRAYRAAVRPATYASLVLGLVVVLALGLTPAGARLVDLVAAPLGGYWLAAAVLGGLAVVFAGQLVTLPLAARRHAIAVRHGLSRQTWRAWGADVLKAYAVLAVLVAAALAAFFTIARVLPQWWWVPAAAGAAGLVVLLSFIFPVLVEPLFAKFTPMPPGELRSALMRLAERDGLPVREVLVADASRRTRTVNAYVSGLGPTRRIVVFDTLLSEAPPEQVKAVAAHELAHAKHRDVVTGTLLGALGAATSVIGLFLLGQWEALLSAAAVGSVTEPQAVALLVAVVAAAGAVTGPAQAMVSRRLEARADAHGLALTGDPEAFSAMHARLAGLNLADPDPPRWEHLLFASHPSTVERMAAAQATVRG
jgi:STE24 endopeptidase